MDPVKRSLYSLHFTVMLLGGTALFSQIIPLSALDITIGRAIFGCIFLFCLVKLLGESWRLDNPKDYFIGTVLGVIMTLHWVTYFAAMQYAGVSVGIIALFTFPVITVFLEPFIDKVRIAWQDVVSVLVVFLGIVLIVPESSLDNDITMGVLVGVFSALLYAVRNIAHRRYFSQYSGIKGMYFQTLIVSVCSIAFASEAFWSMDGHTLGLLVLLGTVFTAVPHAMVAACLRHLRAKTFSLVACMQPLYGVILAIVLLNEAPRWETLVGGIMVISAAIYETIHTQRENNKRAHLSSSRRESRRS
jgi:drug/metabolite transporter (DMT)-like permease